MQTAKDYDLIVKLFDKYLAHKTTKSQTEVGFKKYLLKEQAFPAWLVKNLMKQIQMDLDLHFHIQTYLEAYVTEGMLIGTVKDTAAKMVLKNKFGYEENPIKAIDDGKAKTVRSINIIPAVKKLPAPKEA